MAQAWKITDGSFKGQTIHVAVPVRGTAMGMTGQTIQNARRLQVSERPSVDGAAVEDFGRKPRTFQAELIFFGPDYRNALSAFENLLNPPAPAKNETGILILPDLQEAVYAKYSNHSRTTQTESVTMISVTWIEDFTGTVATPKALDVAATQAALQSSNPAKALPSLNDRLADLTKQVAKATSTLNSNSFVTGLSSLESSVVNVRVALNSVLNLPKNSRQTLISTVQRSNLELSSLGASIKGLANFNQLVADSFKIGSPTRKNSTTNAVDFAAVGAAANQASVQIDGTVLRPATPTIQPVASYPSAAAQLQQLSDAVTADAGLLEQGSSGNTADFSDDVLVLRNQVRDLVQILQAKPSTQVVTNATTSLPEVMFENGIFDLTRLDYYRGLNAGLADILAIPAFEVVNL